MRQKSVKTLTIAIALMILIHLGAIAKQENKKILERKISFILIQENSISNIGHSLSDTLQIPVGVIGAFSIKEADIKIKLEMKNATVKSILNNITKQARSYKWDIENDVIIFRPIYPPDAFLEKLLEVKYDEFLIKENVSTVSLKSSLIETDKAKKIISDYNASTLTGLLLSGDQRCLGKCDFNAKLVNVTLKEVLIHIAKYSGNLSWSVSEVIRDRQIFFNINL